MFAHRIRRAESALPDALVSLKRDLADAGEDVIDLTEGDPARQPPTPVTEAARSALDAADAGYPPLRGLPEFRRAAADRLGSAGVPTDPDRVVVTAGATPAIHTCVQALVDPGDEVVVPRPSWHCYEPIVELAGGTVTPTRGPGESRPHPAERTYTPLGEGVTDRTRLLILNSPANPTGRVFDRADLREIRDLAVEHDAWVLADETYKHLAFDGPAPSAASVEGLGDRTVTVRSLSKPYAMTDWRLGYLSAPERCLDAVSLHHAHSTSCVNRVAQRAGLAALRDDALHEPARDRYRDRRDRLASALRDRGHDPPIPDGTFYLLLSVGDDDAAWCRSALDATGVALVPGRVFGAPGYARLSTTASDDRLREALDRLFSSGFL